MARSQATTMNTRNKNGRIQAAFSILDTALCGFSSATSHSRSSCLLGEKLTRWVNTVQRFSCDVLGGVPGFWGTRWQCHIFGVIPRGGGESSTPRPVGSATTLSEYWIVWSSRTMTAEVGEAPIIHRAVASYAA